MTKATITLHTYLTDRGFTPHVQILDNKCCRALKRHYISNQTTLQLVPLHLHRTNKSESASGTFKDYIIAGISNIDPSFPMHLWCHSTPSPQQRSTSFDHQQSTHASQPKHSSTEPLPITQPRWRRQAPRSWCMKTRRATHLVTTRR